MSTLAPALPVGEYLAVIRREGEQFADALQPDRFDSVVPTGPEWTLRDLAQHLGRVHIWAAAHVEQARPDQLSYEEEQAEWGRMPADPDLAAWYRGAVDRLWRAIDSAPPDLVCWTFLPAPSALQFWARRQSHELTIHRVDAQSVIGPVAPVATRFAVDGIEELVLGFFGRSRSRLRSANPCTLAIRTDAGSWLVHIGLEGARPETGEGPADCTVEGPATDMYYALWNRLPLHDLRVAGDPAVLDLWTGRATVNWS
jgi:uncharacterized protein (TIGR03083 family)